jgi:hypothetical protein
MTEQKPRPGSRPAATIILLAFLATATAYAQEARLDISSLDRLASKASETVDISLDGPMLQLAASALSNRRSADESKIKELVSGLKGVYVKTFEFAKEGEYSDVDLKLIMDQIKSPGWSKVVGVVNKREREDILVFALSEADRIGALVIISAEPKELAVVNIVGPIDLDKLADLARHFGIPDFEVQKQKKE